MSKLFKLNPALDRKALRRQFEVKKRLHIPGILTIDSAERLYRVIANETQWHLVFNEGEKSHTLYPEQLKLISREQIQKIRDAVLGQARQGYQLFYNNYNIYDYYLNGKNMDHPLHRFHEFINSPEFFEFVREITGVENITFADSQATAYGPGHFSTLHSDLMPGKNRQLAYVFNLTPKWQMDWGGILHFLGKDGNVDDGFVPKFNVLNLFQIPQDHAVSYVVPYVPAVRYSITGWLRETDDSKLMKK